MLMLVIVATIAAVFVVIATAIYVIVVIMNMIYDLNTPPPPSRLFGVGGRWSSDRRDPAREPFLLRDTWPDWPPLCRNPRGSAGPCCCHMVREIAASSS